MDDKNNATSLHTSSTFSIANNVCSCDLNSSLLSLHSEASVCSRYAIDERVGTISDTQRDTHTVEQCADTYHKTHASLCLTMSTESTHKASSARDQTEVQHNVATAATASTWCETTHQNMTPAASNKTLSRYTTMPLQFDRQTCIRLHSYSAFKHFLKTKNNHQFELIGSSRSSPLSCLTLGIVQFYSRINPRFDYTTKTNPKRVLTKPDRRVENDGFDNQRSDLIICVNDVLESQSEIPLRRFRVIDLVGQGTFGQVVKCENLDTKQIVAIKVIKNKPAYFNQAFMEIRILKHLNEECDIGDCRHIVRLLDHFIHCNHLCLAFEILSVNLYDLIKQNSYQGLSFKLIRTFTKQVLETLCLLKQTNIIHCDLKPENILLKSISSSQIKVIDFGSSCFEFQTVYSYIQSRFYRSPEVLLGVPYDSAIDIWSLGCIVSELLLGLPLLAGVDEYDQLFRIVKLFGTPPLYMLHRGKYVSKFFNINFDAAGVSSFTLKSKKEYRLENKSASEKTNHSFPGNSLTEIMRLFLQRTMSENKNSNTKDALACDCFVNFLQGLLYCDPAKRWTPGQAIRHPFITERPFQGFYQPPPLVVADTKCPGEQYHSSSLCDGLLPRSSPQSIHGAVSYSYSGHRKGSGVGSASSVPMFPHPFYTPYKVQPCAPPQQQMFSQSLNFNSPLPSASLSMQWNKQQQQQQQQQASIRPGTFHGDVSSSVRHRSQNFYDDSSHGINPSLSLACRSSSTSDDTNTRFDQLNLASFAAPDTNQLPLSSSQSSLAFDTIRCKHSPRMRTHNDGEHYSISCLQAKPQPVQDLRVHSQPKVIPKYGMSPLQSNATAFTPRHRLKSFQPQSPLYIPSLPPPSLGGDTRPPFLLPRSFSHVSSFDAPSSRSRTMHTNAWDSNHKKCSRRDNRSVSEESLSQHYTCKPSATTSDTNLDPYFSRSMENEPVAPYQTSTLPDTNIHHQHTLSQSVPSSSQLSAVASPYRFNYKEAREQRLGGTCPRDIPFLKTRQKYPAR